MGRHRSKKHSKKNKCCKSSSSSSCESSSDCECCEIRIVCPNEQPCKKDVCCNPNPCCQQDPCCPCVATLTGTKTVTPNPPVTGQSAMFTITVTNPSTCPANNVVLTDILTPTLFVPGTIVVSPAGTVVGNTVTVNLGTLNPGASVTVTISGIVLLGGAVTNTATVTASNISAPVQIPIGGGGSGVLTVTKTFSPNPIAAGQPSTFTLTVNNGTATPVTFLLTDVFLGAGVLAVNPVPSGTLVTGAANFTVTGATVAANSSYVVTGTFTPGLAGVITNIAAVIPTSPLGLPISNIQSILTVS